MPSFRVRTFLILYIVAILFLRSIVAQECAHRRVSLDLNDHHSHEHHHHHDEHDEHLCGGHQYHDDVEERVAKLPEELAEEEDLKSMGFSSHHRHHEDDAHNFSEGPVLDLGLWVHAMGCSLLVSMASLICLILLPVFFMKGNPSKLLVDSLAVFGAGAMLGDTFLHQLPHALGGSSCSHSHAYEHADDHLHNHEHVEGHTHSVGDLLVGLSVLSGIVCFLLVEKIVRYVEDVSGKQGKSHAHHHHHRPRGKKVKDHEETSDHQNDVMLDKKKSKSSKKKSKLEITSEDDLLDGTSNEHTQNIQQDAKKSVSIQSDKQKMEKQTSSNCDATAVSASSERNQPKESSNLVFGYLNLFSDGVHNFTDGMALGSAFLLHGSVGGWSRTLFLLAHELPQEVGDFGILVRSGFSIFQALFFNFLSALVALAGTALALILGQDPGNSSLVEGFTAGGFIYIAVAGVLPEMNSGGSSFRRSAIQVFSLILGMSVALFISLYE